MNKFIVFLVGALLCSLVVAEYHDDVCENECGCGGKTVVNINLDDFEIPCCPEPEPCPSQAPVASPSPCPEIPEPTPCPDPPACMDCSVCPPRCDECYCEDCTNPCIYSQIYTVSDVPQKGGFGFYTENFYGNSHNCSTGQQLGTVTEGTLTIVEVPNVPVVAYLEMNVYMKVNENEYCDPISEGQKTCVIRAGFYEITDESRKYRGGRPSQEYTPYWRLFEQYYNTITCDEAGTPFTYPIINKNDNTMAFQVGIYANLWTIDLGAGQWNYVIQGEDKITSDFNVRLVAECPEDGPWQDPEPEATPAPYPESEPTPH